MTYYSFIASNYIMLVNNKCWFGKVKPYSSFTCYFVNVLFSGRMSSGWCVNEKVIN